MCAGISATAIKARYMQVIPITAVVLATHWSGWKWLIGGIPISSSELVYYDVLSGYRLTCSLGRVSNSNRSVCSM